MTLNLRNLVVCAVLSAAALVADSGTVALNGRVTDLASTPLAGAIVTIEDAQGAVASAETGAQGGYSFPSLKPGVYSVRITVPGYAMYENRTLTVSTSRPRVLNVKLAGQMTVSVADLKR
jgi:protocatechuate 3,4-dioxygenase beta subunit